MLVKTYGSAVFGVSACTITVEVNLGGGFGYAMVGLPDNAVKESYQRMESALRYHDYQMPRKKMVII
jgi:magnesium chelatase family protein